MSEIYAPSTAIRERARLTHPSKPEPTIDDVLWYLDEQAKALKHYAESVKKTFRQVGEALRGERRRRRSGGSPP